MFIEPITDRTQADVEYARIYRTGKGTRRFEDLNRIANNCVILRELLIGYGYGVPILKQRTTAWTRADWPSAQDIQNILDDIQAMKDVYTSFAKPETPALPVNSYQKMNDIEQILFDINRLIPWMVAAFRHSGTFNSGMGGIRI